MSKILALNKDGKRDYFIEQELVAGIALTGAEVKSAKLGSVALKGSYVSIDREEAYLVNAHISAYKYAKNENYDPVRKRKLLLKKTELNNLIGRSKEQGKAIVPLDFHTIRGLVKVKLGIGRGKKKYDKREAIKKRETDKKIGRAMRNKLN